MKRDEVQQLQTRIAQKEKEVVKEEAKKKEQEEERNVTDPAANEIIQDFLEENN